MIGLTLLTRGAWLLRTGDDVNVIELSDTLWHACATVYANRTDAADACRRAEPLKSAYAALWRGEHGWKLHHALRRVTCPRAASPEKRDAIERAMTRVVERELFIRRVLRRIEAQRAAERYAELLTIRCAVRADRSPVPSERAPAGAPTLYADA